MPLWNYSDDVTIKPTTSKLHRQRHNYNKDVSNLRIVRVRHGGVHEVVLVGDAVDGGVTHSAL